MAESDQAATAFITPYGPFCFNTMPFGLKNTGATYQRMIQTCLANQIGKTVKAYVDDVVVKSRHVESLVDDLRLKFDNLRKYDIKLNPEKCVFGVPAGKLLGFIVSGRGIEANPAKIRALSQLDIPKDIKQIQKLTGCVAALTRFISCLGEKALPLYRLLRRTEHFEWTDAATAGLEEIKAILATNPILAAPNTGEPMLLYIAATHQVVSAILVVKREQDGHKLPIQRPVYYVSTVLTPCKSRYPHYQKIAYVVFMASQKLRHYFQECSITVASEVPLNDIINNRDATGRTAKWAIELLPFDITYRPRRAIKSQVLPNFVAEWTKAELPKEYGTYSNWIMHFDGSKILAGLGVGVVLTSPTGDTVKYVLQIMYTDSNNAAEYEALQHGLRMAVSMGIQRLEVRGDSNLAISQINGDFDAKDPKMAAYRNAVLKMSARFEGLEFHHIARENNQAVDVLARIRAKRDAVPPNIFLERLFKPSVAWEGEPSINSPGITAQPNAEQPDIIGGPATEITPSAHVIMAVIAPWTEPFLAYLTRQELPEDQNEARCIVRRPKAYKVHKGELYKKSTTGVLQRCISEEEGRSLLAEIHAGLGGHRAAARSLVSKAFGTGFYWPTARADAQDLVQRCVGCQLFANQSHMPPTALQTTPITWPFAVWGLDMVGPLKGGTEKKNTYWSW